MRLINLKLRNIGPFKSETITFLKKNQSNNTPPVTVITGDNGSGKTVILDAIRYLLLGRWNAQARERNIVSDVKNFSVELEVSLPNEDNVFEPHLASTNTLHDNGKALIEEYIPLSQHIGNEFQLPTLWFCDYWTSKLSSDSFILSSIISPKVKDYLKESLSGIHLNNDVSKWICYIDYLKSSDEPSEKLIGEEVFAAIKTAISIAIADSELSHVSRTTLEPIIRVKNDLLTLEKLSSGNLYLLQRFISLISKAYSVIVLNREAGRIYYESVFEVPGVLLIDEAENHLHPKWQKTLLTNILKLFPKLQIIVTTHSPFLVSSVANCNIYVCEATTEGSKIIDETDVYVNKPIDEILTTELFNTLPFNEEISNLMIERKLAVLNNETEKRKMIEQQLLSLNPQYFSLFNINDSFKDLIDKK